MMKMEQSELFQSATKKLALVDITLELPEGFHENDSFEDKWAAASNVIKQYLNDGWALFDLYSGGKDSSVKLCMVLNAMQEFIAENGRDNCPPLVIMQSDTLLENPVIGLHNTGEIARIRAFAKEHNLPVRIDVATPSLSENYLVNIIGGRSIATTAEASSRNCSVMMKVNPIKRMKKEILKNLGKDYGDKVLSLVGKRYDESEYRKADMIAAGERPDKHIVRNEENLLSPIAHFSLDDVYWCIGLVRSEMLPCYSNFESLVETYRAANGGECMVNASEGKISSTSCGARYGCFVCLASEDDKSMDTMIASEEFSYMRYLWAFRNHLQAGHNDPSRRTWLARSVNEDGSIDIKPNSYSPEFTEELLRMALSIQVVEQDESFELGIEPRFNIITMEEIIAIECQWARYGYHRSLQALRIWDEVVEQGNLTLPSLDKTSLERFPTLNDAPAATVPFMDSEYNSVHSGFRDLEAMTAECEDTVLKSDRNYYMNTNVSTEFSINIESLMMFTEFEMERAINKFNNDQNSPATGLNYLLRLGVVSINNGSHSSYERMLRMSNQVWRSGIRPILNDPQKLVEKMGNRDDFKLLRLF